MNEKLQEKLREDFPLMYRNLGWMGCGDGWFGLIHLLSKEIQEKLDKMNYGGLYVTQIKEKFGMLRFYVSIHIPEIQKLISEAESESAKICEMCGKPGEKDPNNYWIKTLCEGCTEKRNNREL